MTQVITRNYNSNLQISIQPRFGVTRTQVPVRYAEVIGRFLRDERLLEVELDTRIGYSNWILELDTGYWTRIVN